MSNSLYPSDLNNDEWSILHSLLVRQSKVGRPSTYDLRDIVSAIFCSARAHNGACYPTNTRLGAPSITTSPSGAAMAPGSV
jgi:hypothetical protein